MILKSSHIKSISRGNANAYWADMIAVYMNDFAVLYEVSTNKRMAAFLAQTAHESGGFTRFVENMNYSAARLQVVFPKYFPAPEKAKAFAGDPVKIGSLVYANRMGNGSPDTLDGYNFRGRGMIQLTGRSMYERFSGHVYGNTNVLTMRPDDVATPILAVRSSLWYWNTNGLNELADQGAFELITRRINGGLNGLKDRLYYWEIAKRVLGVK